MKRKTRLAEIAAALVAILAILLSAVGSAVASPPLMPLATTITLTANGDSMLTNNGTTNTNWGAAADLQVGEYNGGTETDRMILQFDLSSIPAGATINSATLSLYLTNDYSDNARTFRVYRNKRPWDEGTRVGSGSADGVTWDVYSTGNSWQTAGGSGSNDRESSDIGSRAMSASESTGAYKDFSLTASAVREMIPGGTFANNGFIIQADTENNDMYDFASREDATSGHRPKLVIDYSPATPTPTATSPATATPENGGLTNALISYWAMENTNATFGGESLNQGGCGIVNNGTGHVGGALFMGTTSCLSGPDASVVRIDPNGDWTWAGWDHPENVGDNQFILSKYTSLTNAEMYLRWRTGGIYEFCWGSGTGAADCVDAPNSASTNTWHFIAFGKRGSTAFIRVDNHVEAQALLTTDWHTTGTDLRWGANVGNFGVGGGRDEWGLWRSTTGGGGALTAAQLTSLWNNGAGCTYPFTACVTGATPTASPTPIFCGESGTDNCFKNGNMELGNLGVLDSWDGAGGTQVDQTFRSTLNTGLAYCGTKYANINADGMTQRVLLPALTPLFWSFKIRRTHNDSSFVVYPQIEIVKAGVAPGTVGETYIAADGKRGDNFTGSGLLDQYGWVPLNYSVHFLENTTAYYDIHFYNVAFHPGVSYFGNDGQLVVIPPSWNLQAASGADYQIDDVYLSTQGYKSYCPGGLGGPTATPNTTTQPTRTATPTLSPTPNATASATTGPTSTPATVGDFTNCDFEQGLAGWTGNKFSVQLAGGPIGPQYLRVAGSDGYARQPFTWPGGNAYFTFWVGPGSGGRVHITNQIAGIDDTLWLANESSPAWKLVTVFLPSLPAATYVFEVQGNDFVNMDFDGAMPAANGYSYCGSGGIQVTPTSGPTAFVTPTPTLTPPAGASPTAQTATPPPVLPSRTPNATWTATVTAGPATATSIPSNTPTAANNATSTSIAGTSTAAASVTPPTVTATQTGTPPTATPSPMPNPTQQPEPAPNADCNRPTNPLNLAWWVDYEVCRVLTWFVWTPDNSQQMMNMQATLQVYEPLGTLNELESARTVAQQELQQYDWASTGLQGTTGLPDVSILFPHTTPPGLLTGNLQLGPGAPNNFPFVTVCTLSTGQIFGDAMGQGLCATINWLVATGIMGWVQFLFDVAVWVAFARYMWYLVVTQLPQIM